MLLRPNQRTKLDASEDKLFYAYPRFVTHVDEGFIQQLTDLYRDRLKPNTRILDMMSSWVSHLPQEMEFAHVEGHGLNTEELARNPRLDHYFVQDLNENPQLPLKDQDFDAVLNAVSVQYLQYPEAVFAEIYRILKPGGVVIVSFSNRMFYQKAIQPWREGSEASRVELVKSYFELAQRSRRSGLRRNVESVLGFSSPEVIAYKSTAPNFLQWLGAGAGGDPFYAVIAYRREDS